MLNLEYRFLSASSDCGWSSIWFDYAADFQEGMENLKNPNLEGILEKEGMVIALTTENDKTLSVGKVCSGVVKYINDDESTFSEGEFIRGGTIYYGITNKSIVEFWENCKSFSLLLDLINYSAASTSQKRFRVNTEIRFKAIKYAQDLFGVTSPTVELATGLIYLYLANHIDSEKLVFELNKLDLRYERNQMLRTMNHIILDVRSEEYLITLRDILTSSISHLTMSTNHGGVDVKSDLANIVKSCITLAGAIEDIIFYNDSNYNTVL